jgi:hypothetical protein
MGFRRQRPYHEIVSYERIVVPAPASEFERLKARFRRIVRDYATERHEEMPQEM